MKRYKDLIEAAYTIFTVCCIWCATAAITSAAIIIRLPSSTPSLEIIGQDDATGYFAENVNPANRIVLPPAINSGSVSGTAQSIWAYMNNGNGGTHRYYFYIYDSSDNLLLSVQGASTGTSVGWYETDISSSAFAISASTDYRIGFQGEYAFTYFHRNASGTSSVNTSSGFATPPDPWSEDGTDGGNTYAIYITVAP